MLTLAGILIAIAPFVIVLGLLAWTSRRERRRREVHARQVALIDRIHKRLGAVASPVVRRHRRGWQVSMAVPFERPAMSEALLRIVLEAFPPRDRGQRPLEIVLSRGPPRHFHGRAPPVSNRSRRHGRGRRGNRQHWQPLESSWMVIDSSRAIEAERRSKHGAVCS